MGNYALIKDGQVINVIVWDGGAEIDFGAGVSTIELEPDQPVSIGYSYENGTFTAPPVTEEEQAALDAASLAMNVSTKSALMAEASQAISVLQDAIDLDIASEEEAALLLLWKKYRILLNRIDANTPDEIDWPETPA